MCIRDRYQRRVRDNGQHNHGKFPVVGKHHAERKQNDEDVDNQTCSGIVDKRANLNGIVDPRNNFAHAHGVEKTAGAISSGVCNTPESIGRRFAARFLGRTCFSDFR
eukprot:TRINITY_DN4794_c0_g2_i1.p3 TRINITY_DN4794_c0_g2~~TRINITY_DN4794_c0_g2_i1.p3  ORF type:complete len:107 (+),score=1.37 TRINITY_DN4794_c0_g2_i1:3-323(+)